MDESTQDIQLDLFCKRDNHSDLQEKVKELEKECGRLRIENSKLIQQLSLKSVPFHPAAQIPSDLATENKIKLLKSLFKGRTDVFPKRWVKKWQVWI